MYPMNVDDEKSTSPTTEQHKEDSLISAKSADYHMTKPLTSTINNEHNHSPNDSNNDSNDHHQHINHPLSNINIDNKPDDSLQVCWAEKIEETDGNTVKVRSLFYKSNGGIKRSTGPNLFRLAQVQAFKTDLIMDNIATHPSSWYYQHIDPSDPTKFVILFHFQVECLNISFVTYYILEGIDPKHIKHGEWTKDKAFNKLFNLILTCNDRERNNRFKLIPRIIDGPPLVKKVIRNRPCLMGNHVPIKYYRGENYLELDLAVDQELIAKGIVKIAHKFAKKLVVDMSWTIQGEELDELPERVLGGITVHYMDFTKCKDLWGKQYTSHTVDDYDEDDYF